MSIRITCGATSFLAPLDGKTVGEIRAAVKDLLGLTERHTARSGDGVTLPETWAIRDGCHLAFLSPAPVAPGLPVTADIRQGIIVCCQGRRVREVEAAGELGPFGLHTRHAVALDAPPPEELEFVLNGAVVAGNLIVPDGSCLEFRPVKEGCCPNAEKGIPCPHKDLAAWKAWRRERSLSTIWPPNPNSTFWPPRTSTEVLSPDDDPEYREAFLIEAARAAFAPADEEEVDDDDDEDEDDDEDDEE